MNGFFIDGNRILIAAQQHEHCFDATSLVQIVHMCPFFGLGIMQQEVWM